MITDDVADRRHQIAANVRAEISRKFLQQKDIAEGLGISRQSMSQRLAGNTSFSAEEIVRVAELLGVPVGRLTGE